MHTIYYDTKNTSTTNVYVTVENEDKEILITSITAVMALMSELSVTKNQTLKQFVRWYRTSNRKYLYNSNLKRHNSPESLMAGILNNIVFGSQRDFSVQQLEVAQDIINLAADIAEAVEDDLGLRLQKIKLTKIFVRENIWAS